MTLYRQDGDCTSSFLMNFTISAYPHRGNLLLCALMPRGTSFGSPQRMQRSLQGVPPWVSPYLRPTHRGNPDHGISKGAVLGVICHFSPKNHGRKIGEYYRICFRYQKPFECANFRICYRLSENFSFELDFNLMIFKYFFDEILYP